MVPTTVAALVNGELSMMAPISWKPIAILILLGGSVTTGVVALAQRGPDAGPGKAVIPEESSKRAALPASQVSQKKVESRSLLTNGGVEEATGDSPKSWNTGAEIPGVEYLWSRDNGHTGKASLCLKKTAQRDFPIAQWSQTLDRQGDSPRLKVWAWVKADQVTKAILDAQFLDSKGDGQHAWIAYIGPKQAGKSPFTHDWKRYEGVVAIPPGTEQIIIAPQIYGPGKVWFDDLGAEYTSDPAIDPMAGSS